MGLQGQTEALTSKLLYIHDTFSWTGYLFIIPSIIIPSILFCYMHWTLVLFKEVQKGKNQNWNMQSYSAYYWFSLPLCKVFQMCLLTPHSHYLPPSHSCWQRTGPLGQGCASWCLSSRRRLWESLCWVSVHWVSTGKSFSLSPIYTSPGFIT